MPKNAEVRNNAVKIYNNRAFVKHQNEYFFALLILQLLLPKKILINDSNREMEIMMILQMIFFVLSKYT